jgi:hypothetical protein
MAILVQSNKKPSVSFPEQTGSIVTFNSQYAGLPLKSCKVNIPVTQEGTGDPSPDNVRNIVGITSLDFTANSVVKTFTFGQTIYAGELDVLTGIFTATHGVVDLGSLNWSYVTSNYSRFVGSGVTNIKKPESADGVANAKCSIYKITSTNDGYYGRQTDCLGVAFNNGNLWVWDTRYTDATAFKTAMNGVIFVYELETPEVINLGGMDISTLQGENNLFASTGETTASFIKIGG